MLVQPFAIEHILELTYSISREISNALNAFFLLSEFFYYLTKNHRKGSILILCTKNKQTNYQCRSLIRGTKQQMVKSKSSLHIDASSEPLMCESNLVEGTTQEQYHTARLAAAVCSSMLDNLLTIAKAFNSFPQLVAELQVMGASQGSLPQEELSTLPRLNLLLGR